MIVLPSYPYSPTRPWKTFRGGEGTKLPTFFLIGAAKSATTWMTICLNEHPQLFMPRQERHYFSWYYEMFCPLSDQYLEVFEGANDGQIIGENSNTYLGDPGVPARIAEVIPAAKIIACLRNPIDRAYSDYCMHLRLGRVGRSIDDYLDPTSSKWPAFIESGLYAHHLLRYAEYFPVEHIHICLSDDWTVEGRKEEFRRIFRFLGVDETFTPPFHDKTINTAGQGDIPPLLRRFLNQTRPGRFIAEISKKARVNNLLRRGMKVKFTYPEMDSNLRAKLTDYYRSDVKVLSDMLGRDMGSLWKIR